MAKQLLGELPFYLQEQTAILRPSLGALYEIEQDTGLTIPALIESLQQGTATPAMVATILRHGLHAADQQTDSALAANDPLWLNHTGEALAFLLHGLGYAPTEAKRLKPAASKDALPGIDWTGLYKIASTCLGKSEAELWGMTMQGLMLQCEAYAQQQGIDTHSAPATIDDLQALMAQFPDVPSGT